MFTNMFDAIFDNFCVLIVPFVQWFSCSAFCRCFCCCFFWTLVVAVHLSRWICVFFFRWKCFLLIRSHFSNYIMSIKYWLKIHVFARFSCTWLLSSVCSSCSIVFIFVDSVRYRLYLIKGRDTSQSRRHVSYDFFCCCCFLLLRLSSRASCTYFFSMARLFKHTKNQLTFWAQTKKYFMHNDQAFIRILLPLPLL